jgi:hypothetical protein
MASVKSIGAGTLLQMDDGLGTYTAIAEIVSIGELTRERPEVDATNLSSTSREYVAGLTVPPEFDIECHMLLENATHDHLTGLTYLFNNGITRNFRLRPVNETKYLQFQAFVKAHTYGPFELEQTKRMKIRFKVTGSITVV